MSSVKIATDGALASLVPIALVAVTVNVYEVASLKPITVQEVVEVVHVWLALEVTV